MLTDQNQIPAKEVAATGGRDVPGGCSLELLGPESSDADTEQNCHKGESHFLTPTVLGERPCPGSAFKPRVQGTSSLLSLWKVLSSFFPGGRFWEWAQPERSSCLTSDPW